MRNEGVVGGIPTEGANAELNDGELGGGVTDLQVPHVGAVERQGLAPRSARHAGHLEVDGHEVRRPDMAPELRQRRFEVRGGNGLRRKRHSTLRGGGGGP